MGDNFTLYLAGESKWPKHIKEDGTFQPSAVDDDDEEEVEDEETGRKKRVRILKFNENLNMDHMEDIVGEFQKEYLNLKDENYDFLRKDASSTLSKAFSLSSDQLETLVIECRGLSSSEIKEKVEELTTNDLEVVIDGTYIQV